MVVLGSSAFAATEFTAAVSFTNGEEVAFDATLSAGTQLTWDAADINYTQTTDQWKPATAYIIMKSTITKAGGKVFFYQDNKSAASTSKYIAVSSRTETEVGSIVLLKKFNGLVKGGSKGGENGYLPMSFKVSTCTLTNPSMVAGVYGTRYLTDKSDTQLNAAKTAAVAWSTSTYSQVAGAYGFVEDVLKTGEPGYIQGVNTTGYLYVGANFKNVISGESYGSDKIKFEIINE